jgi:DNA-binding GntR family transcriptional regulator
LSASDLFDLIINPQNQISIGLQKIILTPKKYIIYKIFNILFGISNYRNSLKIKQLKTETLSRRAYETIKELILKNELLPGNSISINTMAASLGVSPTPVREAFARLTTEGFLEGEPHRTIRVSNITEEDIRQVYGVRRLLEPQAAYQAAEAVSTNVSLKRLLKNIQRSARKISETPFDQIDKNAYLNIDTRLHEAFLLAIDPFFREVLIFVGVRSLRIRTFAEAASQEKQNGLILAVTEEHLKIIQSLLEEDAKEAVGIVMQHLENGEARTIKAIQNRLQS